MERCPKKEKGKPEEKGRQGTGKEDPHVSIALFFPQFCLQRIRQGLVFYKHLLDSDIFTGEPSLLPDSPVDQLHTSLLGLSQLLQV